MSEGLRVCVRGSDNSECGVAVSISFCNLASLWSPSASQERGEDWEFGGRIVFVVIMFISSSCPRLSTDFDGNLQTTKQRSLTTVCFKLDCQYTLNMNFC